jgi:cobyrinic acid a,c-diamide synthase
MAAFVARGLTVQPFKVCPDFLDGKHHEKCCGNSRPSANLDGWMMGGKQYVWKSFHRHAQGADICIVQGVMGLHGSKDGVSDDGSTQHKLPSG